MRTKLMIALSVLVLAVLNYSIYEKEQIKANGDVVLLELAPVDPRSLMQGDYMRLRYAIERTAPVTDLSPDQKRGTMVIRLDGNNVAQFVRFYAGKTIGENEKLLSFHKENHRLKIVPDAFFFQEGHAHIYEQAKYGVFKFDKAGNHLLIGLADGNRTLISVPSTPN